MFEIGMMFFWTALVVVLYCVLSFATYVAKTIYKDLKGLLVERSQV